MLRLFAVGVLLWTTASVARTSFMPDNDLWKEDRHYANSMDEATFNSVIDAVEEVYTPIIQGLGGQLVIERNWGDPTVNAYADREGNVWKLAMFGGLARRPEINKLGFMMVVCHEMAHHIGGYPNYPGEWASDEGNSDYTGVHACMKRVLANVTDDVKVLQRAAVDKCKRYYKGQGLRVCYHIMSGAKSCADLLGTLNGTGKPSFSRTDPRVVSTTKHEHPAAQCRLDTMSNAAVCKAPWEDSVIPTRSDYLQYSCSVGKEDSRPRCWFAK